MSKLLNAPKNRLIFRREAGDISVPCYRNLNLLAHAQLEELDIGSQCGGHGICGQDKIKILLGRENLTPLSELERKHLSSEELEAGVRLGCQSWPVGDDLNIEAEALVFK